MTLSSEQFHTLYDGAAQPVVLVQDGAVAECNCHAQEFFTAGTALCAYLPQDTALPETLYTRPAILPVLAGGICVSANTQPLDGALLLFLPPRDTRDELAAFSRAAQSISAPLTTLLSVSETLFPLLSEAEDPAMQQNLAVFNRACYQLLRASENLTDLSFIQRGRLPLSLEKTDLVDFLEELSQHADDLCWQAGRTLEVDLPQAPIFVWIDRRQMRRALLALLSNAIKFTAPDGVLRLSLTRLGRRSMIRLSDNGEGMDTDVLTSAFCRYARPEVPEDPRLGAGFSLPVVQAIVQAHGGSVMLQSQKGSGTDALANVRVSENLDILGPLGHGFTILPDAKHVVVVGGGIGNPPMLSLAQIYGARATAICGFRSANIVTLQDAFHASGAETILCTDDGTAGRHALVTEPLKEQLSGGGVDMVYACGPRPMLKFVAAAAKEYGVRCEVSMEERMGCGIGACLVCACQLEKEGKSVMGHVCKDGPVFPAEEVVW